MAMTPPMEPQQTTQAQMTATVRKLLTQVVVKLTHAPRRVQANMALLWNKAKHWATLGHCSKHAQACERLGNVMVSAAAWHNEHGEQCTDPGPGSVGMTTVMSSGAMRTRTTDVTMSEAHPPGTAINTTPTNAEDNTGLATPSTAATTIAMVTTTLSNNADNKNN